MAEVQTIFEGVPLHIEMQHKHQSPISDTGTFTQAYT
jgi:hypothetical protein